MSSSKFDSIMREFCDTLARKFNLNANEVFSVWSGTSSTPASSPASPKITASTSSDPDTEITREKIMASNKDMLAAMCKKKGLKMSGKKEELVQRLVDSLANDQKTDKKPEPKKKESTAPIIKSINERTAELAIRKNKFGNFEHSQTSLVFNTDKLVYGRQMEDGKVNDLTADDIELCKKYKFPYKIPENLNTAKNMDDVKIEDIEDEVLDDDDLEDEIEDEEEEDIPDDEL